MPEYQTTIQDASAILRGSGKVEIARYQLYNGGYFADPNSGPVWENVGAISGLVVEESLETAEEENDNTENETRVNRQMVKITFNQHEPLREVVWRILRDDLDTITDDSAQFKVQSGNKSQLNNFVIRITTKNDGNPFYFIGYKCNLSKGFSFAFQADDADDRRVKNAVEIECKSDGLYNDGLVYEFEHDGGV